MKKEYLFIGLIFLFGLFLRTYHLTTNPPGLYIDEAAIGYNAYKILTTGKDEYGVAHPLSFRSFGDYKMPAYIYMVAGTMAIFGENEFSIRIPAAIFGSITILLLYFFMKELLTLDKKRFSHGFVTNASLLSAFLLSISRWHIQFSRAGFEATVAAFFFLLGTYLAILFWKRRHLLYLLCSYLTYAFTVYIYHTNRILSPLVVVIITAWLWFALPKLRIWYIAFFTIFSLCVLPIALFSLTPMGSERFAQTSSFVEYHAPTPVDKLRVYPMVFIKNYISFYTLDFLFSFGDGTGRHQIPNFGIIFIWQLPFYLLGLFTLFRGKRSHAKTIILLFFFVTPIPASIVRPSPHTLRDLVGVIPAIIVITFGILATFQNITKRKLVLLGFLGCFAVYETLLYFHFYYVHYPKTNIIDWGGGYKQLVKDISLFKNDYQIIAVDKNLTFAAEYIHFYDDSLHPIYIDPGKPDNLPKRKKILYIRPYYGKQTADNIVHNIILPNGNHDIFAQFWRLE